MLADKAAKLDNWPGRTWRDLQDTATMAQVLYNTGGGWENWRRDTDFYPEGDLLWLDVDTTIRKLSDGKEKPERFCSPHSKDWAAIRLPRSCPIPSTTSLPD